MAITKKRYRKPNVLRVRLSTQNNVFSPDEFKALVRYERTRSDRNGSAFSVALFQIEDDSRKSLKRNISEISQFTRSIDCIGWDEAGRISVLLPDTVKEGAAIFAQKVVNGLATVRALNITFDLYTYPEHWLANSADIEDEPASEIRKTRNVRERIESLFVKKIPLWKRLMDIAGSGLLLAFTAPLFLFTALYIKIVSPGPVFFKQTRIGYKGLPFTLLKFRTMKYDNNQSFHGKHAQNFIKDGDVPMEKLDAQDTRIFVGGRVLRKACVDELPQLWNILCGKMSLVGPRPCIPYEAQEYLRWHTHRFDTMPGLSGLWQVSGKNKLTFKQMIRLDITYCQKITFFGDLLIIFRTPIAILKMVLDSLAAKKEERKATLAALAGNGEQTYPEDVRNLASS